MSQVSTLVLLEGHEGYVDVAAWSPLEDVIVTGSSDRWLSQMMI